ncbi:MAG: hypothetical protein H0U27_05300, partial [Nitrosopumilus sp.]|nr:hypothetical protein [Nitrosopumilus sp.]
MISKEYSLEKQVQSLALIGPFMLLVTLTTLLISPSHQQLYLPLIALSGILICWKWKVQGLFTSLALLAIALFYQLFTNSSPEKIFWELLVAAAVALTFSITALSFKEVEDVLCEAQQNSTTAKQEFQNLNEHIQQLEAQRNNGLNQDTTNIKHLNQKLEEQIALTQASEEVIEKVREKMNGISLQNESLLRELFQKRHECDKLSQNLAEHIELTQMELDDQKKAYEILHESKKALEMKYQKEKEELQQTISSQIALQNGQEESSNLLEGLKKEKKSIEEHYLKEIEALHEMITSLNAAHAKLENEKNSLKTFKEEEIVAKELLQKNIEALKDTISQLKASQSDNEADNAAHKNSLDALRDEKKAAEELLQKDIEALKETISQLKASHYSAE